MHPEEKPARPLLGILIGLGVLCLLLIISLLVGGLTYHWCLRVPQATLLPSIPSLEQIDVMEPTPTGITPIPGAEETPVENLPQFGATPTVQTGTVPLQTLSVSFELIVNVKSLNVRTGPGTLYPIIITYPEGTRLLAIGRNEDASWFVIQVSSSQQGWVSVPLVRYDFDRYILPVFPLPPLEVIPPTPYGGALLVPPELVGSQPLAPMLPAKRMVSLTVAVLMAFLLVYLERSRLSRLARTSLRQVLIFSAQLFSH